MKPWLNNDQIQTEKAIQKACKYSENPDTFRNILKDCTFTVSRYGLSPFFQDETEDRCIIHVNLKRGSASIGYKFGLSIHDTETLKFIWSPGSIFPSYGKINGKYYYNSFHLRKAVNAHNQEIIEDLLYSLTASISSEYFIPKKFKDFCNEFGYSSDSIKARSLFESCRDHAESLQSIFTPEDIKSFPF